MTKPAILGGTRERVDACLRRKTRREDPNREANGEENVAWFPNGVVLLASLVIVPNRKTFPIGIGENLDEATDAGAGGAWMG
jgi:hypothetical protein